MTAFHSRRYDAVIFDCDGVLVDSEALALQVELELLAECGLHFDQGDFVRRFMGSPDTAFRDALDAESRERLGRPLRPDFLHLAHEARHRICRERLTEVPGARRAIERLATKKAVASSSHTEFLREKLIIAGLYDLFEPHVYSANLVARGKPHPDIFLHAASALDAEPARCLVLEDSVNGVRAGLAAGMTVWAFVGGGHCDEDLGRHLLAEGAHRVIAGWADLEAEFLAAKAAE